MENGMKDGRLITSAPDVLSIAFKFTSQPKYVRNVKKSPDNILLDYIACFSKPHPALSPIF